MKSQEGPQTKRSDYCNVYLSWHLSAETNGWQRARDFQAEILKVTVQWLQLLLRIREVQGSHTDLKIGYLH
jgi:hypothetical protein